MKEITTEELLDRISAAGPDELNEIIEAVQVRFRILWPDWELMLISALGHTPEEHIEVLRRQIAIMKACIKK